MFVSGILFAVRLSLQVLTSQNSTMRAPRFPLHLKLQYRRVGARDWCDGETENISRSGVLFRATEAVEVNAPVELRLAVPGAGSGGESAEICCRGKVVRTVSEADHDGYIEPGYAVAIEHYDFVPASADFLDSSSP